ncbi:MAG: SURF1 family protein [Alphaproteobacteria bacterium]|jgi:surfeit locus 1 family protein|nr:SURF1 family protein [Alphaproteobacteria bacterium]MBP9878401.1 SURF1 family protein [Alphaproteobacteria bacterium]
MSFWRQKKVIIPSIMTLIMIIVLLSLGSWQMRRLEWKEKLLAEIHEALSKDAVPLADNPLSEDSSTPITRVNVEGTLLKDKSMMLIPRMNEGERGAHLIVPLEQKDGKTYLVDMGWVPEDFDPQSLPDDVSDLSGILRKPSDKGSMQPDNNLGDKTLFWYDMPSIGTSLDLKKLQPFIIERDKNDLALPENMPIPQDRFVLIANNHFQYALTWYSLAIVLLVIYSLYLRRHFKLKPTDTEVEQKLREQIKQKIGRNS